MARNRGPAVPHSFGRVALPFHGGDGPCPQTTGRYPSLASLCLLGGIAAEPPQPSIKAKRNAEVRTHVKELGDLRFAVREKASARLVAIGMDALAALEEATQSKRPGSLPTRLAHYRPVGVRRKGAGPAVSARQPQRAGPRRRGLRPGPTGRRRQGRGPGARRGRQGSVRDRPLFRPGSVEGHRSGAGPDPARQRTG